MDWKYETVGRNNRAPVVAFFLLGEANENSVSGNALFICLQINLPS